MTKSMLLSFAIVHAQSPNSFNASDCPADAGGGAPAPS
jgi:hypothetical protein